MDEKDLKNYSTKKSAKDDHQYSAEYSENLSMDEIIDSIRFKIQQTLAKKTNQANK